MICARRLLLGFVLLCWLAACSGEDSQGPTLLVPDTLPADDSQRSPDSRAGFDGLLDGGLMDAGAEVMADLAVADVTADLPMPCVGDADCPPDLVCAPATGSCVECYAHDQCDDGNVCTFNYCSDDFHCQSNNADADCDDDNSCTFGDYCEDGECVATEIIACDDGIQCTDDFCEGDQCMHAPSDGPCEDGDPCTLGDGCVQLECIPGTGVLDCDDGNPCTVDSCQPMEGCIHAAADGPCDDGLDCIVGESCVAGECKGYPLDCGDGNPCTGDECDEVQGCVNEVLEGAPCDDGNFCTADDHCGGGGDCAGTPAACNDDNPCTFDSCTPETGCVHQWLDEGACNDGNGCTQNDACSAGVCTGQTVDCDDGDPCTFDSCQEPLGTCISQPEDGLPCDDGNPCTGGDFCEAGLCQPGQDGPACDDGNPCTQDSCTVEQGCKYTPTAGTNCNDNNQCTSSDKCNSNGVCVGTALVCQDSNPCTVDGCDENSGCTFEVAVNQACDDANPCTDNDKCSSGGLCNGIPKNCDDANPCTDDGCDLLAGCIYTGLSGQLCNDNDACTSEDQCVNGSCTGVQMQCADNDACTSDYCLAGQCVFQPIEGCGTPTCSDKCGQNLGSCFCDEWCQVQKDCCPDVCTHCPYNWCCTPKCEGKECGSDGCGGDCGSCPEGKYCQGWQNKCAQCDCDYKKCGEDQCGNSCGTCAAGQLCIVGLCVG
jgi:hypothetical protein